MADLQGCPINANGAQIANNSSIPQFTDRDSRYSADKSQGPSLNALHSVAADIKNTLTAAIAEQSRRTRSYS